MQVLWVTLAGLALGTLVFFALTQIGALLIRDRYMSEEAVNRRKARLYADFSRYVSAQGVSGRDTAAVARWTASHEYVTIFLFAAGREQQLYAGGMLDPDNHSGYDPQVHGRLYPIRFSDGLYQVAIGDNSQVRQRLRKRAGDIGQASCFAERSGFGGTKQQFHPDTHLSLR